MMHIAESYEIVDGIGPFVLVMLIVVKLKHLPWIVRRKHTPMPATLNTLEPVALQNRNTNKIGNRAVVFIRLTVFLQNIYANGKILATTIFSNDGPTLFRPQLPDPSRPFFLVFGQILELFSRYLLPYILAEIFDELLYYRSLLLPNLV